MIRWVAAGFAVLFTLVVAMGYVPAFVTAVHGEDRVLFDLFKISLLDDVRRAERPGTDGKPMLNAPHIAIATVMLGLVHWWVPRESAPAVAR